MAKQPTAYTDAQIAEALLKLPDWYHADGAIRRAYDTDGWPTTLMLVNALGFAAEAADHHPDLTVTWGRVEVALSTHSARGITGKDFELARKFDDVALWRPPAGSTLAGTSSKWIRAGSRRE